MNSKSFTLIELLVVISILGLLAGVIIITMQGAKDQADIGKAQEFSHAVRVSLGANLIGEWRLDEGSGIEAKDSSGEDNHGSLLPNSSEPTYVNGIFDKALLFDGINDYVDCGNAGHGDYDSLTISAWFKASSFSPIRWRTMLHRNDGTSVGSSVFFIGLETGSSQIVSTIGAGTGAGYMAGATGINAQIDEWYYIVNSWNGTTAKVYVNGVEKKTYSLLTLNHKTANTKIGSSGFGNGYLFNGTIDEVQIYNKALLSAEIQQLYAQGAVEHGIVLNEL